MTGGRPADRSRARERTRLAWNRTVLAGTVVTLLALRQALHGGLTAAGAAYAALAVLGWSALAVLARTRLRTLDRQPPPPAGREPALLAILVVAGAVLAIALAVLP
ncbi:MAG TPA: DUF202 domain-containing protein [Rugosimonospora sp.]|nr:DUF202 domain-containing protein [Rugosimonospora sp.]